MLEHIKGLKWVGDLSLQDADLLAMYGKQSDNVLEFGIGGSTLILSQACNSVVSVETESKWVELVEKRLEQVPGGHVEFLLFNEYKQFVEQNKLEFDMIFVDCHTSRRLEAVLGSWKYLKEGGRLLIHDTRKSFLNNLNDNHPYVVLFPRLFENLYSEIRQIDFCASASDDNRSNITVITKGKMPKYVSWQDVEDKPKWSYGSDMSVIDQMWKYEG